MSFPQAWKVPYAHSIKQVVKIPVIVGGTIREPESAESILEQEKADFVALGRTLFADPEWPNKAAEERIDDIRKCISCNYCHGRIFQGLPIRCALNAALGREHEFAEVTPASTPKRIMVVGGGVAGLEASRVAAERGHAVSLYEKDPSLGAGQMKLAVAAPGKEKLKWVRDYLVTQVKKQKRITVHLQTEVTEALVDRARPDILIVATGAMAFIPSIKGIEGSNVVTAHEVLGGGIHVEARKVCVLGGRQTGCEVALFLAEQGNMVTIISRSPISELAQGAHTSNKADILWRLKQLDVRVLAEYDVREISSGGLTLIGKSGAQHYHEADWVVVARGATSVKELAHQMKRKVPRLYTIGDALEPRDIAAAIYDGALIARQV
jgi:pyruvate/2-oxoglutarate dehydrogenase complex dihydrolipoamide dehydrogenase (E3) component